MKPSGKTPTGVFPYKQTNCMGKGDLFSHVTIQFIIFFSSSWYKYKNENVFLLHPYV